MIEVEILRRPVFCDGIDVGAQSLALLIPFCFALLLLAEKKHTLGLLFKKIINQHRISYDL